jgi:hypothetical protein
VSPSALDVFFFAIRSTVSLSDCLLTVLDAFRLLSVICGSWECAFSAHQTVVEAGGSPLPPQDRAVRALMPYGAGEALQLIL